MSETNAGKIFSGWDGSGASGPALHRCGDRWPDDTANVALGGKGTTLGKNAAVKEIRSAPGPPEFEDPTFLRLCHMCRHDFRGGNFKQRTEIRIKHGNSLPSNEKANPHGRRRIPETNASTIDDGDRAQFVSLYVDAGLRLRGGQKNGYDKHNEPDKRERIVVPGSDGEKDKSSASEAEGKPKKAPRTRAARKV